MEGALGDQILAFGRNLRNIRQAKGLTLVELAAHASISAALLSRIERGQVQRSSVFRFDERDLDDYGRPKLAVINPYLAWAVKQR
jgi:transcriptional regulator with XRE-family HTH domain